MNDMRSNYTAPLTARQGIAAKTLRHVQVIHRQASGPFTAPEAAAMLSLDVNRARRLLAYLADRGWLTRIRRGLYAPTPLEADDPQSWQEDPWILAERTFAPCYIGGWSACEHWGLTDQVFREIMVISGRHVRHRHIVIQGVPYRIKVRSPDMLFGTRTVWRGRVHVAVSDPHRTIVDILDDPSLAGGMRHVAEVVQTYFSGEQRHDDRLLEYAERLGNRSVFKRLGYLIEALQIDAPELRQACLQRQSAGITALDPTSPTRGHILRRWNLRVNVAVI